MGEALVRAEERIFASIDFGRLDHSAIIYGQSSSRGIRIIGEGIHYPRPVVVYIDEYPRRKLGHELLQRMMKDLIDEATHIKQHAVRASRKGVCEDRPVETARERRVRLQKPNRRHLRKRHPRG